jgi:23S rRNA pseudouridine2605 synthase|tara:strand:- start:2901 stop:3626 length:726 start_codon:yes stop_codon:yes gene_type:complete
VRQRIHKILADSGHGSRRGIERLIKQNKIEVNGEIATLGQLVSEKDSFKIEGKKIVLSARVNKGTRILMYNKKVGEICTRHDTKNRPTVFENLPKLNSGRWVSVGRLDINTSGLMLFTNKGELANRLMHPSSMIEREYIARIHGLVTKKVLQKFINGVELEDGLARFTDVQEGKKGKTNQWFAMVIMEGKTREVRRLWESQNLEVSRLKRVRYGNLFLPASLKQGSYKELSKSEVNVIEHL